MPGAYVMGLAFAFGWTPCIGPVLAAILSVAGSTESVGRGMALLAFYSLGLGIPFMLAAFSVDCFLGFSNVSANTFHCWKKSWAACWC